MNKPSLNWETLQLVRVVNYKVQQIWSNKQKAFNPIHLQTSFNPFFVSSFKIYFFTQFIISPISITLIINKFSLFFSITFVLWNIIFFPLLAPQQSYSYSYSPLTTIITKPNLPSTDIVNHLQCLLLHVPNNGDGARILITGERQTHLPRRCSVQDSGAVQIEFRSSFEKKRHFRDLYDAIFAQIVTRVQNRKLRRLWILRHSFLKRWFQGAVRIRRQPCDNRAGIDDCAGGREDWWRDRNLSSADLHSYDVDAVEIRDAVCFCDRRVFQSAAAAAAVAEG